MPELIGKLQATFKSTLHPSPEWRKCLCMSCFGRVKSALASSPLFTRSRLPPLFTRKICVILQTEQVELPIQFRA